MEMEDFFDDGESLNGDEASKKDNSITNNDLTNNNNNAIPSDTEKRVSFGQVETRKVEVTSASPSVEQQSPNDVEQDQNDVILRQALKQGMTAEVTDASKNAINNAVNRSSKPMVRVSGRILPENNDVARPPNPPTRPAAARNIPISRNPPNSPLVSSSNLNFPSSSSTAPPPKRVTTQALDFFGTKTIIKENAVPDSGFDTDVSSGADVNDRNDKNNKIKNLNDESNDNDNFDDADGVEIEEAVPDEFKVEIVFDDFFAISPDFKGSKKKEQKSSSEKKKKDRKPVKDKKPTPKLQEGPEHKSPTTPAEEHHTELEYSPEEWQKWARESGYHDNSAGNWEETNEDVTINVDDSKNRPGEKSTNRNKSADSNKSGRKSEKSSASKTKKIKNVNVFAQGLNNLFQTAKADKDKAKKKEKANNKDETSSSTSPDKKNKLAKLQKLKLARQKLNVHKQFKKHIQATDPFSTNILQDIEKLEAAEKEAEEQKLQKAKNDASGLGALLADSETNTNNNSPDDLLSKNTNNLLEKTSNILAESNDLLNKSETADKFDADVANVKDPRHSGAGHIIDKTSEEMRTEKLEEILADDVPKIDPRFSEPSIEDIPVEEVAGAAEISKSGELEKQAEKILSSEPTEVLEQKLEDTIIQPDSTEIAKEETNANKISESENVPPKKISIAKRTSRPSTSDAIKSLNRLKSFRESEKESSTTEIKNSTEIIENKDKAEDTKEKAEEQNEKQKVAASSENVVVEGKVEKSDDTVNQSKKEDDVTKKSDSKKSADFMMDVPAEATIALADKKEDEVKISKINKDKNAVQESQESRDKPETHFADDNDFSSSPFDIDLGGTDGADVFRMSAGLGDDRVEFAFNDRETRLSQRKINSGVADFDKTAEHEKVAGIDAEANAKEERIPVDDKFDLVEEVYKIMNNTLKFTVKELDTKSSISTIAILKKIYAKAVVEAIMQAKKVDSKETNPPEAVLSPRGVELDFGKSQNSKLLTNKQNSIKDSENLTSPISDLANFGNSAFIDVISQENAVLIDNDSLHPEDNSTTSKNAGNAIAGISRNERAIEKAQFSPVSDLALNGNTTFTNMESVQYGVVIEAGSNAPSETGAYDLNKDGEESMFKKIANSSPQMVDLDSQKQTEHFRGDDRVKVSTDDLFGKSQHEDISGKTSPWSPPVKRYSISLSKVEQREILIFVDEMYDKMNLLGITNDTSVVLKKVYSSSIISVIALKQAEDRQKIITSKAKAMNFHKMADEIEKEIRELENGSLKLDAEQLKAKKAQALELHQQADMLEQEIKKIQESINISTKSIPPPPSEFESPVTDPNDITVNDVSGLDIIADADNETNQPESDDEIKILENDKIMNQFADPMSSLNIYKKTSQILDTTFASVENQSIFRNQAALQQMSQGDFFDSGKYPPFNTLEFSNMQKAEAMIQDSVARKSHVKREEGGNKNSIINKDVLDTTWKLFEYGNEDVPIIEQDKKAMFILKKTVSNIIYNLTDSVVHELESDLNFRLAVESLSSDENKAKTMQDFITSETHPEELEVLKNKEFAVIEAVAKEVVAAVSKNVTLSLAKEVIREASSQNTADITSPTSTADAGEILSPRNIRRRPVGHKRGQPHRSSSSSEHRTQYYRTAHLRSPDDARRRHEGLPVLSVREQSSKNNENIEEIDSFFASGSAQKKEHSLSEEFLQASRRSLEKARSIKDLEKEGNFSISKSLTSQKSGLKRESMKAFDVFGTAVPPKGDSEIITADATNDKINNETNNVISTSDQGTAWFGIGGKAASSSVDSRGEKEEEVLKTEFDADDDIENTTEFDFQVEDSKKTDNSKTDALPILKTDNAPENLDEFDFGFGLNRQRS